MLVFGKRLYPPAGAFTVAGRSFSLRAFLRTLWNSRRYREREIWHRRSSGSVHGFRTIRLSVCYDEP